MGENLQYIKTWKYLKPELRILAKDNATTIFKQIPQREQFKLGREVDEN